MMLLKRVFHYDDLAIFFNSGERNTDETHDIRLVNRLVARITVVGNHARCTCRPVLLQNAVGRFFGDTINLTEHIVLIHTLPVDPAHSATPRRHTPQAASKPERIRTFQPDTREDSANNT